MLSCCFELLSLFLYLTCSNKHNSIKEDSAMRGVQVVVLLSTDNTKRSEKANDSMARNDLCEKTLSNSSWY